MDWAARRDQMKPGYPSTYPARHEWTVCNIMVVLYVAPNVVLITICDHYVMRAGTSLTYAEWAPLAPLTDSGLIRACAYFLTAQDFRLPACDILKQLTHRRQDKVGRPCQRPCSECSVITVCCTQHVVCYEQFSLRITSACMSPDRPGHTHLEGNVRGLNSARLYIHETFRVCS